MPQGGHGLNNLVGIEEDFTNLVQATAEERVAVTNLTDINILLSAYIAEYAENLFTKESKLASVHKAIANLQDEIKNLNNKLNQ